MNSQNRGNKACHMGGENDLWEEVGPVHKARAVVFEREWEAKL